MPLAIGLGIGLPFLRGQGEPPAIIRSATPFVPPDHVNGETIGANMGGAVNPAAYEATTPAATITNITMVGYAVGPTASYDAGTPQAASYAPVLGDWGNYSILRVEVTDSVGNTQTFDYPRLIAPTWVMQEQNFDVLRDDDRAFSNGFSGGFN